MNKSFILRLLPGLLPLFIFIIADEIWGTKIGLIVALGFGILELFYTYIKTQKIEKFILSDTILLVALGAISILLNNEIFLKLKPFLNHNFSRQIISISTLVSIVNEVDYL